MLNVREVLQLQVFVLQCYVRIILQVQLMPHVIYICLVVLLEALMDVLLLLNYVPVIQELKMNVVNL